MGDSMSKEGEKRSTSKNNIFMKKCERIKGTYMLFAIFDISLVFGNVLEILKKGPFNKNEN